MTRLEREEFLGAVQRLQDKSGGKTMTGAEATQWMARQGG